MAQTMRSRTRMCLFAIFFHIWEVKKQFWGANRHFQAKREIEKRAYYQNHCIDSNQILHSDTDHQMPFMGGPPTHITNTRRQTTAIMEKSKNSS